MRYVVEYRRVNGKEGAEYFNYYGRPKKEARDEALAFVFTFVSLRDNTMLDEIRLYCEED